MANQRTTERARAPSTVETPINHDRLRQIFTNMRGRSFTVSFLPVDPVVRAATPEERVEKTERGIVATTKNPSS
ncbi:MAG: hypothetical protein ACHREM_05365 [Polyangiales bacterium]